MNRILRIFDKTFFQEHVNLCKNNQTKVNMNSLMDVNMFGYFSVYHNERSTQIIIFIFG